MGGVIDHPSSGLGIVRPPSARPDGTFAGSAVNVTYSQLAFAVEAEIGIFPFRYGNDDRSRSRRA